MEIFVTALKFAEMGKKLRNETIPDGYILDYVILANKKYAVTGGCSNGKGTGWDYLWIDQIIPLERYHGELKPLKYSEHFQEVDKSKRKRGYAGLLIKYNGIQHIFIGDQITVRSNMKEEQLELF